MKTRIAVTAIAVVLAAQAAQADVTVTATVTNDYDFRGISQTSGRSDDSDTFSTYPALQLGIDYTSGLFYAGLWGSNVDFGKSVDGNVEVDVLAGLAGEFGGGWRWNTGVTYYMYPGSSPQAGSLLTADDDKVDIPNYWEVHAGGGYGPVDVTLWYSPSLYDSNDSAEYLEANASIPLPTDIAVDLHAGYSFGDYFKGVEKAAAADDASYGGDNADYFDWSVGLSRSFGHLDVALKYVDTITDNYFEVKSGAARNDGRVILSVATTWPWADAKE